MKKAKMINDHTEVMLSNKYDLMFSSQALHSKLSLIKSNPKVKAT